MGKIFRAPGTVSWRHASASRDADRVAQGTHVFVFEYPWLRNTQLSLGGCVIEKAIDLT